MSTTEAHTSGPPNSGILAAHRVASPATVAWLSFLAARPISPNEVPAPPTTEPARSTWNAVTSALGSTWSDIASLAPIQRASTWIELRSEWHRIERASPVSLTLGGVLHGHDPVLRPPTDDHPVITAHSLRSWHHALNMVSRVAGLDYISAPSPTLVAALATKDAGWSLDTVHRVSQAPRIRCSIAAYLGSMESEERREIGDGLARHHAAGCDLVELVDMVWMASELASIAGTDGDPSEAEA